MSTRWIITLMMLLSCCALAADSPQNVNFATIQWYAKRAAYAYRGPQEIQQVFPNTVHVATTARNVQFFIEHDRDKAQYIIAIRGTDNFANVKEDADYVPLFDPKLNIWVHRGFDADTQQVFQALTPLIDHSSEIIVTGHSLGAAIASMLMIYLHEADYKIGPSINFGQPKFTNANGVKAYAWLPLLRIVDENDVVPLVPPMDFFDAIHGAYAHIGPEVILLPGQYYSFLNAHQQKRAHAASFWDNIANESVEDHLIKNYLRNITAKLAKATAVPYREREKFVQQMQ